MGDGQPRLLDQVRDRIRRKHYSIRTEQDLRRLDPTLDIAHNKRHPRDMGAAEVEAFLTHLAVAKRVSASTQNQAKSAVLFFYKEVLGEPLPWLEGIESAKRSERLPVVRSARRAGVAQLATPHTRRLHIVQRGQHRGMSVGRRARCALFWGIH